MKIFITGAKGQLGLELVRQLRGDNSFEVLAVDQEELDITEQNKVFSLLHREKPDIVINCAAYTNVDGCEADENTAFRVNVIGVQNLAAATYAIDGKIVHISTDYVFDGTAQRPLREYDRTNPQSVYGKSKLQGEELVSKLNPRHFIIRTAWLYGDGNNFVKTMLKLAQEKDELSIVDDQIGSPTSTLDLAKVIIALMQTEHYGLYHGTCEGSCSWHEFAQKIFEIKNIKIKTNKITTEALNRPAPRPKYSVLDNFMLKLVGLNTFRYWETALIDYLGKED